MLTMATVARECDLSGREGAVSAACALYWHCADYHEGQWSLRYRILSTLAYRPGACETGPQSETVDADIYASLAAGELDPEDVLTWIESAWTED